MPVKTETGNNIPMNSWTGEDLQISLMAEAEALI